MVGVLKNGAVTQVVANLVVITSISAPVFNPQLDASIDSARYTREGTGASYEEAFTTSKI